MEIITAETPEQYQAALELIKAYMQFLGENLCFQDIAYEYEHLPIMYGAPTGALLLCRADDGRYAGMVALRQKGEHTCEMKRLYVLPAYAGLGIGKQLSVAILEKAVALGYSSMVLDTLPRLEAALHVYHKLGFVEVPAYYANPLPGVVYMQKNLLNVAQTN